MADEEGRRQTEESDVQTLLLAAAASLENVR